MLHRRRRDGDALQPMAPEHRLERHPEATVALGVVSLVLGFDQDLESRLGHRLYFFWWGVTPQSGTPPSGPLLGNVTLVSRRNDAFCHTPCDMSVTQGCVIGVTP